MKIEEVSFFFSLLYFFTFFICSNIFIKGNMYHFFLYVQLYLHFNIDLFLCFNNNMFKKNQQMFYFFLININYVGIY